MCQSKKILRGSFLNIYSVILKRNNMFTVFMIFSTAIAFLLCLPALAHAMKRSNSQYPLYSPNKKLLFMLIAWGGGGIIISIALIFLFSFILAFVL